VFLFFVLCFDRYFFFSFVSLLQSFFSMQCVCVFEIVSIFEFV
jgi:hypothetical protein